MVIAPVSSKPRDRTADSLTWLDVRKWQLSRPDIPLGVPRTSDPSAAHRGWRSLYRERQEATTVEQFRIHLSPPDVGPDERELLLDAFDSNWIAPVGPHVDAFEAEVVERLGAGHAVALSSGTAALHLALLLEGVGPGDRVLIPTMTFAATANAVTYVGGEPVFVDVDASTWQLDPVLAAEEVDRCAVNGRPVAAIIPVDLYGQCYEHDRIAAIAETHGLAIIEDAAEALGSTYRGEAAGTLGDLGVLSFNGNKIITTSGGGMLLTADGEVAAAARHLATQARDPAPHYQHSRVGFNYRLSNLLAAVGRGQLRNLDAKVARRRAVNAAYRRALGGLGGIDFMPFAPYGEPNAWLTCITVDPVAFGATREDVRLRLLEQGIEARPLWKPLHLQPVFSRCRVRGGGVAESLFERGLCLPSGSNLADHELDEIVDLIATTPRSSVRLAARLG